MQLEAKVPGGGTTATENAAIYAEDSVAPVNDPFTWPKSSDSSSDSVSAPQFIAPKGWFARVLWA